MSSQSSRATSMSMKPPAKSASMSATVTVSSITTSKPPGYTPTHHIGNPPTSFRNPWPSSPPPYSLPSVLHARFFNSAEKNFVPVPTDRSLLVPVVTPDWGSSDAEAWTKLRATWIGHASFMIEFPSRGPGQRGVRVLLDPVFSERMSPVTFAGPKRFTPTPCTLEELPEVDFICISHNHYDHCDTATLQFICRRSQGRVKVLCGLGVGENLEGMGLGADEIVEMDWWEGRRISVDVEGVSIGDVKVVCTPCQHGSGRGIRDHGKTLWCSYAFEEVSNGKTVDDTTESTNDNAMNQIGKKLFFAGDTAYRAIPRGATEEEISALPVCTAFKETGDMYGPFDLALLPIGCYSPRWWMSAVHCAPEDSICIHKDIKSKKSLGMHYGVLRGGISQYYEDVTEPPQRWKDSCERSGLKWEEEIALCGVGETVLV